MAIARLIGPISIVQAEARKQYFARLKAHVWLKSLQFGLTLCGTFDA